MNKISLTLLQSSLVALCLNASVLAGEVIMFDYPPSAGEMGNILFSNKTPRPEIKTRSIAFSKVKTVIDQPLKQRIENADSVGLPIKFSFNSAGIREESRPFLDEVGKMMTLEKFSQEKLLVEGHTDASGPEQYNFYLSEKRAKAVKSYLLKNHKISANRLSIAAQGETSPLPEKDPFAAINRRVQFYQAH